MATIQEVIQGLKDGRGYKRVLKEQNDPGEQYVRPNRIRTEFRHDVCGENHGGWGGTNQLLISFLEELQERGNHSWPQDGWELLTAEDEQRLAEYPPD